MFVFLLLTRSSRSLSFLHWEQQGWAQHCKVWSHEIRAGGQNPLPHFAGHNAWDAAQVTADFMDCKCTLFSRIQYLIHWYPQVLLQRRPSIHSLPILYKCLWLYSRGAEPCTWPCCTSWGLHGPPSQVCPGPSAWHPFPPACWVHHRARAAYHSQTL